MRGYKKPKVALQALRFSTISVYDKFAIASFLGIFISAIAIYCFFSESHYILPLFSVWFFSTSLFCCITLLSFFKQKNRLLSQKIIFYYTLLLFTFIVFFTIFQIDTDKFTIFLSISIMLSLLMIMPYMFITLPRKVWSRFIYEKILGYKSFEVSKSDFYTNALEYNLAIEKDERAKDADVVFLFSIQTHLKDKQNFDRLKENFAKLIYFWYAYRYERVYLRFILPAWSIFLGFLFFIATLTTLDKLESNIIKMSFVVLFLTLLFIVMLYQINTTLDPKGYLNHIIKEFRRLKINFRDGLEPAQKLFIFLDANFLVYIYDKK